MSVTATLCEKITATTWESLTPPSIAAARRLVLDGLAIALAGTEEEAIQIQDLYLSGKKKEAEALVPDEFLEKTTLCGPEGYVKERIEAFREAGVTHLQVHPIPTGDQTAADLVGTVKRLIG